MNVERLVVSTGSGNDHLGNADHDTDDYLDGGAGSDSFLGGAGRDTWSAALATTAWTAVWMSTR